MRLKILRQKFSVCRLPQDGRIPFDQPFVFAARTDEELSLVCPSEWVPSLTNAREDGWKGFRIEGVLDFGLVGILARITSILAENGIAVFAVSTYNTDYVFLKQESFDAAIVALRANGYEIA